MSSAPHEGDMRTYLEDAGIHRLLESFVIAVADRRPPDVLLFMEQWASQQRLDREASKISKNGTAKDAKPAVTASPKTLPSERTAFDRAGDAWRMLPNHRRVVERFFQVLSTQHATVTKRLFGDIKTVDLIDPFLAIFERVMSGKCTSEELTVAGKAHGANRGVQHRHFHYFLTSMQFVIKSETDSAIAEAKKNAPASPLALSTFDVDAWNDVLHSISAAVAAGAVDAPTTDAAGSSDAATNTIGKGATGGSMSGPGSALFRTGGHVVVATQAIQDSPRDNMNPASPISIWTACGDPVALCQQFFDILFAQHGTLKRRLFAGVNISAAATGLASAMTRALRGQITREELRGLTELYSLADDGQPRGLQQRHFHYFLSSMLSAVSLKLGKRYSQAASDTMHKAFTALVEALSSTALVSPGSDGVTTSQEDSLTNTVSAVQSIGDMHAAASTMKAHHREPVVAAMTLWSSAPELADRESIAGDFMRVLLIQHPVLKRTLFRGHDIALLTKHYAVVMDTFMSGQLSTKQLQDLVQQYAPTTANARHATYWLSAMLAVVSFRLSPAGKWSESVSHGFQIIFTRALLAMNNVFSQRENDEATKVDLKTNTVGQARIQLDEEDQQQLTPRPPAAAAASTKSGGATNGAAADGSSEKTPLAVLNDAFSTKLNVQTFSSQFFGVLLGQHPMLGRTVFRDLKVDDLSKHFAVVLGQVLKGAVGEDAILNLAATHGASRSVQSRHINYFLTAMLFTLKSEARKAGATESETSAWQDAAHTVFTSWSELVEKGACQANAAQVDEATRLREATNTIGPVVRR